MHALLLAALLSGLSDEPYPAWESTLVKTSAHRREKPAGHRLSPSEIAELVRSSPPIPFVEVTAAVRLADGTIWASSPRGLMRRGPGDLRWRLFHSRVWLADDAVVDLMRRLRQLVLREDQGGNQLDPLAVDDLVEKDGRH